MRIIKKSRLLDFFKIHPQGMNPLLRWHDIVRRARWSNLAETRGTFPTADEVTVSSGRKVVIFNIKKNDYRLITAVHYEKIVQDRDGDDVRVQGKVYLFFFLTHAEYDKESWKVQL